MHSFKMNHMGAKKKKKKKEATWEDNHIASFTLLYFLLLGVTWQPLLSEVNMVSNDSPTTSEYCCSSLFGENVLWSFSKKGLTIHDWLGMSTLCSQMVSGGIENFNSKFLRLVTQHFPPTTQYFFDISYDVWGQTGASVVETLYVFISTCLWQSLT